MMLGVRRAGITTAAGVLQKAGLISYRVGRMTITDRPGLENVACACYGFTRRAADRLFARNHEARGDIGGDPQKVPPVSASAHRKLRMVASVP